MRTMQGVNFYDTKDVLYSHSGVLALDEKLAPIGVFLPKVTGFDVKVLVDDVDANSAEIKSAADAYKALVGT